MVYGASKMLRTGRTRMKNANEKSERREDNICYDLDHKLPILPINKDFSKKKNLKTEIYAYIMYIYES